MVSRMKQSVKLILLAVLFSAYRTTAQDDAATDPDTDAEPTSILDTTNQQDTKRAGRMMGGATVSIANYPYVATVEIQTGARRVMYSHGTIVSNTQVLTTASTVEPSGYAGGIKSVQIRAGSNYQDMEGFIFAVSKCQIHLEYDINLITNDLAVITITGSFSGYPNVQPIAIQTNEIPFSRTNPTNCLVVGWGSDSSNNPTNLLLSRVDYKLAADASCNNTFDTMQCAEPVSGSICYDNMGFPLVCNNRLYGVHPMIGVCQTGPVQFAKLSAASMQAFQLHQW
uniref:Putative trypsin n=1 Tax=Anopheles darlingi TaxID=43151 RepID=A0A2M4DQX6_ANODA